MTEIYENVSRGDRLRTKCRSNDVGDEFHIMLSCPNESIVQLRNRYIPHYRRINPTMNKFTDLMQNKNVNILTNIYIIFF